MPLEIDVSHTAGGVVVVTLAGPLTLGTNLKVAETQIGSQIDKGTKYFVLDLGGVPYIDSAGLGMLMYVHGRAEERGGGVRLARVSERVASMLRMTRTEALLVVDPDVSASLQAFSSSSS